MINTFITLDYELFFGKSGSVEKTMINPTKDLLTILNKYQVKAVFFVDVGYILSAENYENKFPEVKKSKNKVIKQLQQLVNEGHQIQLHIHSHWEDAYYDGKWNFPMQRYRLHDFNEQEINTIVKKYKNKLEEISKQKITSFRAGGWCIQPFDKLKKAFIENGILLDSTVFEGGQNIHGTHFYDFKKTPQKTIWKFSNSPIEEDSKGEFTEIPISSYRVAPFFYWKFVVAKKMGGNKHKQYGDGFAVKNGVKQKLRLLFTYSNTVVSIDGFKSNFLQKSFNRYIKKFNHNFNFVIIGHPKAFTPYSLQKLDLFLEKNKSLQQVCTFKI